MQYAHSLHCCCVRWHTGVMMQLVLALIAASTALAPQNAIVVGGSSGMGKAAAKQFVKNGGHALLVSRSADKLQRAREEILHATGIESAVDIAVVDAADEASVAAFAAGLAPDSYDALVVSAAGRAPHGPVAELDVADAVRAERAAEQVLGVAARHGVW